MKRDTAAVWLDRIEAGEPAALKEFYAPILVRILASRWTRAFAGLLLLGLLGYAYLGWYFTHAWKPDIGAILLAILERVR
jgi:hypothetical protein